MNSRTVGRPKDEELTSKILDATYRLLSEHSYHEISLVKVAEVAGVSRKALYSRWQNKIELVVEAFNLFNPPQFPEPQLTVREQILSYLAETIQLINHNPVLFRDLLADILGNPQTLVWFDVRFSQPRQEIYRELLNKGIQKQEFRADLDIELISECLSSVLRERIIQGKTIDRAFVERLIGILVQK